MNTINKNYQSAEVDQDDERINRLIAKYNCQKYVCESSEKRDNDEYDNFEIDKNCDFSSPTWKSLTSMQTYPMQVDHGYIYKIYNTDSTPGTEKNDSTCNMNVFCDDSYYNFSKNMDQQTSKDYLCKKSYAEKTTYCRPISKKSSTNCVKKVMEKNSKLQLLLTKIIIARQKEKEKVKWDSYVKNLMMKTHSYRKQSMQFSRLVSQENINPLVHSDSYREILHDLYNVKNESYLKNTSEHDEKNSPSTSVYENRVHCFPSTSSESQVKIGCNKKHYLKSHNYRSLNEPIAISNEDMLQNKTQIKGDKDVQTHITFGVSNNLGKCLKDDLTAELQAQFSEQLVTVIDKNETENKNKKEYDTSVESLYELNEIKQPITQEPKILSNRLEDKLETVINLFNKFILETKPKGCLKPKESFKSVFDNIGNEGILNSTDSATSKPAKKKKNVTIVGNVMTNTSLCAFETFTSPKQFLNSRHEKILYEEIEKNNKLRNEIEAMLNPATYRSCRLRINIDIPTRERSTEVTDSLSKTQLRRSQEGALEDKSALHNQFSQARQRDVSERQCKSTTSDAVNTDPVGLLAMLRFSTEALKQILSLMPSVNRWYLSQEPPFSNSSHYVCNVCGLTFVRPSQLSAHVLGHDLGHATDCRHGHALAAEAPSPFQCEYCGQQFSRAYCCELHRQTCGRRLDRPRGSDVFVMLR